MNSRTRTSVNAQLGERDDLTVELFEQRRDGAVQLGHVQQDESGLDAQVPHAGEPFQSRHVQRGGQLADGVDDRKRHHVTVARIERFLKIR